MKLSKPGSQRRKILHYYALAVVLPGIVLGFLAYRGIRNDQALREKENLRRLEMYSQAFFSEIDTSFVQFMNEQTADSMLSDTGHGDTSVLVLFIRDTSGLKKLITHQLLYLPAELITVKTEQLNPPTSLKEGIRLEFIERRFSDALRFYQDIVLRTKDPAERIQALLASARLYYKMNQPEQAKNLYDKIRNDYHGNLLNGQIPLALTATLEILKINKTLDENSEMIDNSRKYLELLLYPPCEYTRDQFDMFYQSFEDIIQNNDPVTDSLLTQLDTQRTRSDYLIRILNEADLILTSSDNRLKSFKRGLSIIPLNSAELSGVYLSCNRSDGKITNAVIDFPVYLKSVSEGLIIELDKVTSLNIKVENDNGELIFSNDPKDETGYLAFPFPEYFPRLSLLLSENKLGFLTTLLKAGSGIYLFIFILIALLMVLGFVFVMYSLNTELRLNKLKSEFISNVSHDFKSPLTSIRMMTEMLHHNRVQTEERKSAYYSAMLEESEHLSHLIDNILDFSRIDEDRKKYDFTNLDMDELLMKFLESTRERIKGQDFEIRYDRPDKVLPVRGDRDAILQVFYNLIDNAIKFSGSSRVIDVTLSPRDNEIVFCVKDYGIGISAKDQERIFDRFYRGDKPQKLGIKGSGIGLTIVKQIVEAHGGEVGVESEPGKGSMFIVRIPLG